MVAVVANGGDVPDTGGGAGEVVRAGERALVRADDLRGFVERERVRRA